MHSRARSASPPLGNQEPAGLSPLGPGEREPLGVTLLVNSSPLRPFPRAATPPPPPLGFTDLDADALAHVTSYLTVPETLALAATSKGLLAACRVDAVWAARAAAFLGPDLRLDVAATLAALDGGGAGLCGSVAGLHGARPLCTLLHALRGNPLGLWRALPPLPSPPTAFPFSLLARPSRTAPRGALLALTLRRAGVGGAGTATLCLHSLPAAAAHALYRAAAGTPASGDAAELAALARPCHALAPVEQRPGIFAWRPVVRADEPPPSSSVAAWTVGGLPPAARPRVRAARLLPTGELHLQCEEGVRDVTHNDPLDDALAHGWQPRAGDLPGMKLARVVLPVQSMPSTPALPTYLPCGAFAGSYGPHGDEWVELRKVERHTWGAVLAGLPELCEGPPGAWGGPVLEGFKLTGDKNVPGGRLTFLVDALYATPMPAFLAAGDSRPAVASMLSTTPLGPELRQYLVPLEERGARVLAVYPRCAGQINLEPGVWAPSWVPASLLVYAPGTVTGLGPHAASPIAFSLLWVDRGAPVRHVIDYSPCPPALLQVLQGSLAWPHEA